MQSTRMRAGTVDALRPLARRYRFNPYRNYRIFSVRAQIDVLIAELAGIVSLPEGVVHVVGSEDSGAAVIARTLSWDTAFFGLPMARIDYVLGEDAAARDAALNLCLETLRDNGICHVSAQADAADIDTAVLLEQHGFRLTGGTVTYIAHPRKNPPKLLRAVGHVRNLQPGDGPEVIALAEEAFRPLRSRFHTDPSLPRDRVEALYTEWARRCVDYQMADTVFVSEGRDGRLLGFLAFRRREPVSTSSGVPLFGGGLGACRPNASGAYLGLIYQAVRWAGERDGVAETQTQNYNFPALAIYEAAGLRSTRAGYNFALSLDRARDHSMTVE